MNSAQSVV